MLFTRDYGCKSSIPSLKIIFVYHSILLGYNHKAVMFLINSLSLDCQYSFVYKICCMNLEA